MSRRGTGSHALQILTVFPSSTHQKRQGSSLLKDPGETNIQPGNPDFQKALNPNFPGWPKGRCTFSIVYVAKCIGDAANLGREPKLAVVAAPMSQGNIRGGRETLLWGLKNALEAGGFSCCISPWHICLCCTKLSLQLETGRAVKVSGLQDIS